MVPKRDRIEYEDGSEYYGEIDSEEEPHGIGKMTDASGAVWTGCCWDHGSLHGVGDSLDVDGTRFKGQFENGQMREGETTFSCGGKLVGSLREGKYDGEVVFVFPDGLTKLAGTWKEGVMQKAFCCGEKFEFEGSFPGLYPCVMEPYERQYCYVKRSGLAEAGEGLFAKTKLSEGLIVSYYW
jgi:hypothetical protein